MVEPIPASILSLPRPLAVIVIERGWLRAINTPCLLELTGEKYCGMCAHGDWLSRFQPSDELADDSTACHSACAKIPESLGRTSFRPLVLTRATGLQRDAVNPEHRHAGHNQWEPNQTPV